MVLDTGFLHALPPSICTALRAWNKLSRYFTPRSTLFHFNLNFLYSQFIETNHQVDYPAEFVDGAYAYQVLTLPMYDAAQHLSA